MHLRPRAYNAGRATGTDAGRPALTDRYPGEHRGRFRLHAYFELPVRPRSIGSMQVRWTLRLDAEDYRQITGFLRDDDAQPVEPGSPTGPRSPSE